LSNAKSDAPTIAAAGRDWPLRLVRHAAARRYRLVFDAVRGELRLTLPRRASERQALAWAREQQGWIAGQVARGDGPVCVEPGARLPLRGVERTILWDAARPRKVVDDGAALHLGGPRETVGARLGRWLKSEALALLDQESRLLAAAHGIRLTSVSVADPRSRWGSCAADGRLRYSWRLIMAPDHVRRATVAHEVAHRVHMHHGPEFHALVDELNGGSVAAARDWLRTHGRGLHRYRFSACPDVIDPP
jgi:predicted metal-dependent hydrolase